MSARRLITLIQGLPDGTRTHGGGGWLVEHELAASLLEVTVQAHSRKKSQFKVPRPEVDRPKPKASTKAIKSRFQNLRQQLKGGEM